MKPIKLLCLIILLLAGAQSCKKENGDKKVVSDTPESGTLVISSDESFKPVMEDMKEVFESQNPKAKVQINYKTEEEALNDYYDPNVKMLIVTQAPSKAQQKYTQDKYGYSPGYNIVAFDAVAVVVNKNAKDSVFTLDEVREIVNGTSKKGYVPVLDGKSGTGTVHYVLDSILKGKAPAKPLAGVKNSEEVIKVVKENPKAVGFVGLSWVGNPEDTKQVENLKNIRIAAIECAQCKEKKYYKASQGNIKDSVYPYNRPLYYILKENYTGIGFGFANFMQYQKGQLIFKRSYLMPGNLNLSVRKSRIKKME